MLIRDRFPILSKKTYLANHSLGAVPASAEASLKKYFDEWSNLGILAWDGPWFEMIREFSKEIEFVLGASVGTVVPMENVTRGFSAVASSLDWKGRAANGKPKNKIILTSLEFITSYPFWQGWAEMVGARVVQVESPDGISVPLEDLLAEIDDETLIVPTSHVYFRSGAIQDLQAITRRAHEVNAYVLGDGYQSVGIIPVDVVKMEIDFYVGGSHKWLCGGAGAGFLYVRESLIGRLEPKFSGWFGIENPFEYEPTTRFKPSDGVMRFMAGTPSVPALYAAIEGIRIVNEWGLEKIRAHSLELTESIISEALDRNIEVKTPKLQNSRAGMVCIDFPKAKEATAFLSERGVVVDYRPNCGIRVSPHFYNNAEDLRNFWAGVDGFLSLR